MAGHPNSIDLGLASEIGSNSSAKDSIRCFTDDSEDLKKSSSMVGRSIGVPPLGCSLVGAVNHLMRR